MHKCWSYFNTDTVKVNQIDSNIHKSNTGKQRQSTSTSQTLTSQWWITGSSFIAFTQHCVSVHLHLIHKPLLFSRLGRGPLNCRPMNHIRGEFYTCHELQRRNRGFECLEAEFRLRLRADDCYYSNKTLHAERRTAELMQRNGHTRTHWVSMFYGNTNLSAFLHFRIILIYTFFLTPKIII